MKTFIVVDHSLKGFSGHHFEYTLACAKALATQGCSVEICCNKMFKESKVDGFSFHSDFSRGWTETPRFEKIRLFGQIFLRTFFGQWAPFYVGRFGSELIKVLAIRTTKPQTELLFHTLSFTQLFEIAEALDQFPRESWPKCHVVLRYDPGSRTNFKIGILKLLFLWLKRRNFPFHFYSDTNELCAGLEKLFGTPLKLLPIIFFPLPEDHHPDFPIGVGYLGDAREEKGFQNLPGIVRQTLSRENSIVFHIQLHINPANNHNQTLKAAAEELEGLASSHPETVRIYRGSLEPDKYQELLLSSDIVLLPYEPVAYRWRSSGILVQSRAAGKLVLVPKGTSMASMQGPENSFSHPSEIADKLSHLRTRWPLYKAKAREDASSWRATHSLENFARQILGD